MPYTKDTLPSDHTEFGGGSGLIDPVLRADRNLTAHQEVMEIYASNPDLPLDNPNSLPETAELARDRREDVGPYAV